jgi:hypothetical protein
MAKRRRETNKTKLGGSCEERASFRAAFLIAQRIQGAETDLYFMKVSPRRPKISKVHYPKGPRVDQVNDPII